MLQVKGKSQVKKTKHNNKAKKDPTKLKTDQKKQEEMKRKMYTAAIQRVAVGHLYILN